MVAIDLITFLPLARILKFWHGRDARASIHRVPTLRKKLRTWAGVDPFDFAGRVRRYTIMF